MGESKKMGKKFRIKNYLNYIVIAVALVLFILFDNMGILGRSELGLLSRIAYSIVLAVSLNLVVGFLGELSLGHAGFMCVGAYIGCYFANAVTDIIGNQLIVFVLSLFVGGLVAAVFGFVIGLPALRLKGDYLAIVTLAFGEIVRNLFKNLPYFGAAKGMQTNQIILDRRAMYIVSFIIVLLVLFLIQNLIQSKHGRAITAIRDNEIAAKSMGINITYYKLFVFIFAAFFAGVAGVMYGHQVSIITQSTFSYNYSIEILVMVVLGGMGSISGSIIAATLITYINFILQNELSGELAALKLLIYAIILILVVIFSNAPALKPFREKFNIKSLIHSITKAHKKPENIKDDDAEWNRIESKIQMDELLSLDVQNNKSYTPDKPEKGDKK